MYKNTVKVYNFIIAQSAAVYIFQLHDRAKNVPLSKKLNYKVDSVAYGQLDLNTVYFKLLPPLPPIKLNVDLKFLKYKGRGSHDPDNEKVPRK